MPVSIKTVNLKYKNSQGQYVGVNTVGETATAEQIAAIEAKGEEVIESIPADYSELAAEVGTKTDKVIGAVNNNFAALDANGNLKDSGHKHSDYLTAHQDVSGKADKVSNATSGNFAGLDANGNLVDSGHKHSDYLTAHQDISGKADKVSSATNGNFAGLDANGNLKDSGHKHSDYLTAHQDISGKADKVSSATNNNFAGLDANGNLKDSGHKHSDYLTAHQDISGKADKVSSATNGNFAGLDGSGNLTDSGHKHSDYQPAVVVETVSGSTPSITGADNHRYVCGTVSSISITPPSTGIIDVIFTSGTTPAVLSGVSGVSFPGWFNPSSLSASTVYEINIMDGQYGAVMAWT